MVNGRKNSRPLCCPDRHQSPGRLTTVECPILHFFFFHMGDPQPKQPKVGNQPGQQHQLLCVDLVITTGPCHYAPLICTSMFKPCCHRACSTQDQEPFRPLKNSPSLEKMPVSSQGAQWSLLHCRTSSAGKHTLVEYFVLIDAGAVKRSRHTMKKAQQDTCLIVCRASLGFV